LSLTVVGSLAKFTLCRRRLSAALRNLRFVADGCRQPCEIYAFLLTVVGSLAKFTLCRRELLAARRNLRFVAGSCRQPAVIYGRAKKYNYLILL
jgi:hypothetical protein